MQIQKSTLFVFTNLSTLRVECSIVSIDSNITVIIRKFVKAWKEKRDQDTLVKTFYPEPIKAVYYSLRKDKIRPNTQPQNQYDWSI